MAAPRVQAAAPPLPPRDDDVPRGLRALDDGGNSFTRYDKSLDQVCASSRTDGSSRSSRLVSLIPYSAVRQSILAVEPIERHESAPRNAQRCTRLDSEV